MEIPQWSALLLDDQLARLADEITLGMIITPRDRLVSVTSSETASNAFQKMANYFDQLPVIDKGKLAGMLFRKDIPDHIDESSMINEFCRSTAELDSVHADQSIQEAIKHLCEHEICVVFDTNRGEFCGLLHYADLNKQAVRVYCYLWTSALEMSLAELLEIYLPNHDDWISALSDQRQIQVLGRCEFGRRQNIELSPIEGLELSDLINIWAKRNDLLEILGLSKARFKKQANHLIELRHVSMHPVRTLLKCHADVRVLDTQVNDLHFLVKATTSAIGAHRDNKEEKS